MSSNKTSADIALHYQDNPISADEIKSLENKITQECRRYLIGKLCLTEMKAHGGKGNISSVNERIGQYFGYTAKYTKHIVYYSIFIDRLLNDLPNIAIKILNGKTRFTTRDSIILKLTNMDFSKVKIIMERLANEGKPIKELIDEQYPSYIKSITVKDMPAPDPDGEFKSLALTIPSWVGSIDRVYDYLKDNKPSDAAHAKLLSALTKLQKSIALHMAQLVEVNDEK